MRWRRVSRVINEDGSILDTFYDETAYPVLSPWLVGFSSHAVLAKERERLGEAWWASYQKERTTLEDLRRAFEILPHLKRYEHDA